MTQKQSTPQTNSLFAVSPPSQQTKKIHPEIKHLYLILLTAYAKISNNRFCVFLSSKVILDTLLEKSNTITVNDHTIPMRRLINPAKKIIISNVCPSIPNQTILNALKNIDITPVSEINHLKAGINLEGYDHILSFRRQ
ncbi:Hypothetical protein CINCED_3A013414, partial [Cinara cedri]